MSVPSSNRPPTTWPVRKFDAVDNLRCEAAKFDRMAAAFRKKWVRPVAREVGIGRTVPIDAGKTSVEHRRHGNGLFRTSKERIDALAF